MTSDENWEHGDFIISPSGVATKRKKKTNNVVDRII